MRVKVAQCWDDGVVDDIRLTEILRTYGAKASFNLNYGMHGESRSSTWKYLGEKDVVRLARSELGSVYEGFTIANHGYRHVPPARVEPEVARQDMIDGKQALEQYFQTEIKGYAYPGGSFDAVSMQMVRETGHVYGRTVRMVDAVYPPEDPMALHPSCDFRDADFWEKFESAKQHDNLFYFMGHSYQFLTEADWNDFIQKMDRLTEAGVEWVELPQLFS